MHPVLGTMMPKVCEAPHLPTSRFQPSCSSELNEWGGVHLILQKFTRIWRDLKATGMTDEQLRADPLTREWARTDCSLSLSAMWSITVRVARSRLQGVQG